jgi:hypothetical protein
MKTYNIMTKQTNLKIIMAMTIAGLVAVMGMTSINRTSKSHLTLAGAGVYSSPNFMSVEALNGPRATTPLFVAAVVEAAVAVVDGVVVVAEAVEAATPAVVAAANATVKATQAVAALTARITPQAAAAYVVTKAMWAAATQYFGGESMSVTDLGFRVEQAVLTHELG